MVTDIFTRECELAGLKLMNECTLVCELGSCGNDDVYFEAGGNNIFTRVIESITKFFNNLIEKFKKRFGKKTQENASKLGQIISKTALKNKKVKVTDYKTLDKLTIDTRNKLNKCKSKQEADSLMDKYRKNRAKIFAGTGITVGIGGILLLIKNKNPKILENMKKKELTLLDTARKGWEKKIEDAKKRENAIKKSDRVREKQNKIQTKQREKQLASMSKNDSLIDENITINPAKKTISDRLHPNRSTSYTTDNPGFSKFTDNSEWIIPYEVELVKDSAIDWNNEMLEASQKIKEVINIDIALDSNFDGEALAAAMMKNGIK